MVEFSLVFLVFLMMVFGLMELGKAAWTYNTVAHAARMGARYAMVHGSLNPATKDQIKSVVKGNAVGLDSSKINVEASWKPSNARGNTVQVEVSYPFEMTVLNLIVKDKSFTVKSTSNMIIAN